MNTAFAKEQYDLAYDDGIENHWWHLARNRIVLSEIRKFAPPGPEVLDVGCGRGIAVKYLCEQGITCAGVELATARPLPGVDARVRYGTNALELAADERARYDVVTLLDVIEHLPDPESFIAAIIKAFPRLSRLVITVPARQELWSNYDDYFGHYRRYSLAMLDDLARVLKLRMLHRGYFFHSVYLPARAMAAVNKPRSTRVDPPRGYLKSLHRGVSLAMLFENLIVPARIPGASAIACLGVRR